MEIAVRCTQNHYLLEIFQMSCCLLNKMFLKNGSIKISRLWLSGTFFYATPVVSTLAINHSTAPSKSYLVKLSFDYETLRRFWQVVLLSGRFSTAVMIRLVGCKSPLLALRTLAWVSESI